MIAGKRKAARIYSDKSVTAFLAPNPACVGHIIVVPNDHLPILEAVPDAVVGQVFEVANRISISLFEAIRCEGTNIVVHNGIEAGQEHPHFLVNIIARTSGDGMLFEWMGKPMGEEALAAVELKLKEEISAADSAGKESGAKARAPEEVSGKEGEKGTAEKKADAPGKKDDLSIAGEGEEEENYLIKQLRRMP
ncbi:HIT family protein [Candidatus Woesearchaeota archaeon]|nr:HIT family protein [Candidatus Woesearchaeota archaeon]